MPAPEPFVDVPLRPRFFQSSAFFPMPVVLLSTRGTDGAPNLAPYSLCFPHVTGDEHQLALVTRAASKTGQNLARSGRIAVCFIPDDPALLANCKVLSAPVSTAQKMAQSVFTLVDSARDPGLDGLAAPPLVGESIQVFECSLVRGEPGPGEDGEHRYILRVDAVKMQPRWAAALESGRGDPKLPVDYGFRRGSETWLSRPRAAVSGPRLRPRFEIEVERAPEKVLEDFGAALARPDAPIEGKVRGDNVQLTIPEAEHTYWSPHLDLRVEPRDGGGSLVRARIGPHPQVWTLFTSFHFFIGFLGIAGLMYGISQAMTNESPWALWALPIALFLHAFVAGAAFIGQGLGADQTYKLRSFLDGVLDGSR